MRWLVLLLLAITVAISGCTHEVDIPEEKPIENVVATEALDNRYNGELISIQGTFQGQNYTRYGIKYTKGIDMEGYFLQEIRPALDWINENTPEGSIFFNWWDYGHMIQGYTGRDVVIFSPSVDMLWSVSSGDWDEEKSGLMSSNEEIKDVAFAFLSSDPNDLKDTMQKYNADYVFVTTIDESVIVYWLEKLDAYKYISENKVNEIASELIIFRVLNNEAIEGFAQVYSDSIVKIYKLGEEFCLPDDCARSCNSDEDCIDPGCSYDFCVNKNQGVKLDCDPEIEQCPLCGLFYCECVNNTCEKF